MVLFQHNVEAAIWERHARVAKGAIRRAFFTSQWRRMAAWEGKECRRFDHVIAVSDADRDAVRSRYGVTAISSVPTGVDAEYFSPSGREIARTAEIVFTGSMDWMPNVDGITWFCEGILPIVRRAVPEASLTIVGRNPTPAVTALASRYPGVTVTGTVSDVRPFLERAAAVVVPLRVGGGTRLKIYEGMAMGRPTVSTSIGAEGLPMINGEEILIADEAPSFADAVVRLLSEPAYGDAIGRQAAERVRRDFGWAVVALQFASICAGVVSGSTKS
jgi:glycosyltransferase involved in cell wall biosynthesis